MSCKNRNPTKIISAMLFAIAFILGFVLILAITAEWALPQVHSTIAEIAVIIIACVIMFFYIVGFSYIVERFYEKRK